MQVKRSLLTENTFLKFSRRNGEQETITGRNLQEGEGYLKKTLVFKIMEESVNVDQRILEAE